MKKDLLINPLLPSIGSLIRISSVIPKGEWDKAIGKMAGVNARTIQRWFNEENPDYTKKIRQLLECICEKYVRPHPRVEGLSTHRIVSLFHTGGLEWAFWLDKFKQLNPHLQLKETEALWSRYSQLSMKSFRYRRQTEKIILVLIDSPDWLRITSETERTTLEASVLSAENYQSVSKALIGPKIKCWLDLLACAEVEARWEEKDDLSESKLGTIFPDTSDKNPRQCWFDRLYMVTELSKSEIDTRLQNQLPGSKGQGLLHPRKSRRQIELGEHAMHQDNRQALLRILVENGQNENIETSLLELSEFFQSIHLGLKGAYPDLGLSQMYDGFRTSFAYWRSYCLNRQPPT